jgi:predicted RNase H-like HicB family nuclease
MCGIIESCSIGREGYCGMEKFTAVFEQEGKWWIGYVEELPGANTQGRTLEEARENLKEAVQLIIESNRELARRETEGKEVIREDLMVAV